MGLLIELLSDVTLSTLTCHKQLTLSVISCRKGYSVTYMCCLLVAMYIDRPNTPKEFEGNGSADTETYTVSWEAPEQSDTARPVSYYVIKLQLVGTEMTIRVPHNQTQYMFTDLLPGNQYNASIAAVNQVGTSNYTALLNFSTLPTGM